MKNPPKITDDQTYTITLRLKAAMDYGSELKTFYSSPTTAISMRLSDDYVVSVEHVTPPVVYFKPGDVVRRITDPITVCSLGTYGFMNMYTGRFHTYGEYGMNRLKDFNSEKFEKVKI